MLENLSNEATCPPKPEIVSTYCIGYVSTWRKEMQRAKPPFERLWNRTDTSGECWTYEGGSKVKGGYRLISTRWDPALKRSGTALVHRVMYEVVHGPVPDGLELRHLCATANCIHPDHVVPGTRTQNEHDKDPYRLPFNRRRTAVRECARHTTENAPRDGEALSQTNEGVS